MNGQFPSPDTAPGLSAKLPDQHRLVAALLISCLLHLALLTAPYLGERTRESPPAATENQKVVHRFTAALQASQPPKPAALEDIVASAEPAEAIGVLPFSAPPYYTTDQLSKRPQPLGSADLEAPEIRPIVASGKMIVKLWIDEFGEVNDVEVEKTELPEVFSRSTVAAFKRLRFKPGERSGVRVRSVMRIEVSYDDVRSPAP
ncbi:MAG: TonB family protein [Rhodocyclaceae bacterium]|nr:MAG: TonB family protein [Rhodocyclaceae bacterium]